MGEIKWGLEGDGEMGRWGRRKVRGRVLSKKDKKYPEKSHCYWAHCIASRH